MKWLSFSLVFSYYYHTAFRWHSSIAALVFLRILWHKSEFLFSIKENKLQVGASEPKRSKKSPKESGKAEKGYENMQILFSCSTEIQIN